MTFLVFEQPPSLFILILLKQMARTPPHRIKVEIEVGEASLWEGEGETRKLIGNIEVFPDDGKVFLIDSGQLLSASDEIIHLPKSQLHSGEVFL